MGDHRLLDTMQVVNGLAVLLSFFVGYKYALKRNPGNVNNTAPSGASGSSSIFANFSNNYKMVLVVRNDLGMGKGKIGAQCGHGAVGAYQKAVQRTPTIVRAWENTGCAKIALRVDSERELMAIKRAADAQNLITCLIHDAGRTQIAANSKTVLAIGPAAVQDIDKVTGHLKLL